MAADFPSDADDRFRVVIMSGAPPRVLARLLTELCVADQPRRVTGVLYWVQRAMPLRKRVVNFATQLRKPAYLRYVVERIGGLLSDRCQQAGRFLWKLMHASFPQESNFGVAELAAHCRALGIRFQTTADFHSKESLAFVAEGRPDMGIVYGTPILKPGLFEIPRLGSVNLHQRKVPDYRGGGPIALWELLDGAAEIGVTVHRVATKLDAGAVIRSACIPIEPFDTLNSLEMKAHVVGIDLLTAAVNDFATGTANEIPQSGTGRMFRNPKPEDVPAIMQQLQQVRPNPKVQLTYPLWKLLARFAVFTPWLLARNWYRRVTGTFPLIVLYHHVITDRPHFMGMSTDQFLNQLNYLRRYYTVVDLQTGILLLKSGRIERPTVVLTFDDGYQDNVLSLRAAALDGNVPATLYVCSDHIHRQLPFGHDVKRGSENSFPPMTWDELRKMESWGYQFGAHTRTHFDCGSTDEAVLRREITDCRREIEAQVGHAIEDFSFPFGLPQNISRAAWQIASDHYSTVASAYGGVNTPGQAGKHHIYRIPHPASLLEVELLLQSILVFGQPDYWTGGDDISGATMQAPVVAEQRLLCAARSDE